MESFSIIIPYPEDGGGGVLLWKDFSDHFSFSFFSDFLLLFFSDVFRFFTFSRFVSDCFTFFCFFQIIRCLIKSLLKNSTQIIFEGGTT